MAKRIFLSHAYADKNFVKKVIPLIATGLGVVADDIFCSSVEGHGVLKGANFVDAIREEVTNANVIIALMTPAYLESAFCMAELGAAWALNSKRFPIIVPPLDFKVVDATLLGIVATKIDDEEAMTQLLEDVRPCLGTTVKGTVASRAIRYFLEDWENGLCREVKSASKVDAHIYEEVEVKLQKVINERDDAERELNIANERVNKLSKAERFADVEEINKSYEEIDWEEDFLEIIRQVKEMCTDLGGVEVCRQLIMDNINIDKPIDTSVYRDQFERAHEVGVYDPHNKMWDYESDEVVKLFGLLERVKELFDGNPIAEQTLRDRGEQYNPMKIRFWEDHVGL